VADPDEARQPGLPATMRAKAGPSFVPKPPRATPQWFAAANFTRPLAAQDRWIKYFGRRRPSGTTMRRKAALGAMRLATADEKRSPCQGYGQKAGSIEH
jgi:hypothetical protein